MRTGLVFQGRIGWRWVCIVPLAENVVKETQLSLCTCSSCWKTPGWCVVFWKVFFVFFLNRWLCWKRGIGLGDEYALTIHLGSPLIWVHHGNFHARTSFRFSFIDVYNCGCLLTVCSIDKQCFRLHGVCNENPLAPLIGRLGLPLYRTSGDNSVLYDHDLER